jgi:hypothetical protein
MHADCLTDVAGGNWTGDVNLRQWGPVTDPTGDHLSGECVVSFTRSKRLE